MKYAVQIVLLAVLIVAGFFGYSRYRETELLKERTTEAFLAMDQNFSLMMNGWNFSQVQMLFAPVMSVDRLKHQLDAIRQNFGSCQLNVGYACEASLPDEKSQLTVFCRFDMNCEKTKGTGEVTWIEQDDTLKIQKFRVRKI